MLDCNCHEGDVNKRQEKNSFYLHRINNTKRRSFKIPIPLKALEIGGREYSQHEHPTTLRVFIKKYKRVRVTARCKTCHLMEDEQLIVEKGKKIYNQM